MKKEDNYSVEIIRYNILKENATSFESAYREAGKNLQNSPYCLGYTLLHGEDEENHFILTIQTSKEDHLDDFRKSAQFQAFFNLVKPYFKDIEEMKHYKQTSISWNRGNQRMF